MGIKKVHGSVTLSISDSSSIQKLLLRAGFPVWLKQVNCDVKALPQFEFEFHPGLGRLVFKQDGYTNIVTTSMVVTAVETDSDTNKYGLGHVCKNVSMVDPSGFPKWHIDQALQVEVSSLYRLERGFIPEGESADYSLMSADDFWLNCQLDSGSLSQFGQFCIMPAFTRSYLLFLKLNEESKSFNLSLLMFID